ncbi:MAG: hypothetical protein ACRD0K_26155 [Egibacteraceae bacterium]
MSRVVQVRVRVQAGEQVDAVDLAELAIRLREELLALDVAGVDLASAGPAPAGTRGGDALAAGALIVSMAASSGLLKAVVDAVSSWVARPGQRSVRLELDGDVLEVAGVSGREQRRLIQTWIDRHTTSVNDDAGG